MQSLMGLLTVTNYAHQTSQIVQKKYSEFAIKLYLHKINSFQNIKTVLTNQFGRKFIDKKLYLLS
jgi:hypothetical protein